MSIMIKIGSNIILPFKEDKTIILDESSKTKVQVNSRVELKFTSESILTVKDILNILFVRKNLILNFLLNKPNFDQTI